MGNTSTVLITGGAGFIGSHLAEELLDRGYHVQVIDELTTGSMANIEHLKPHPGFSYFIDTVMNQPLMAELVDQADLVFHLAAAVGVRLIIERPIQTIETNIKATELVLELTSKKAKPMLFTSTSEVYGKLDKELFSEEDPLVLGPTSRSRWSYAASKIVDEFLARAYFKEQALPVVIVRLFNIVGPRQTGQYGMVVPRFVRQALLGEPITVYGDGSQRRCFGWVKDAVEAMIALMDSPGAHGEVFNVGSDAEISIYELAVMVKELTGSTSDITLVPYEQAYEEGFEDMDRRRPDISKLRRQIGFAPSCELPETLERIIAHERTSLGLVDSPI